MYLHSLNFTGLLLTKLCDQRVSISTTANSQQPPPLTWMLNLNSLKFLEDYGLDKNIDPMLWPVKTMKVYSLNTRNTLMGSYSLESYQLGLRKLGATIDSQSFFEALVALPKKEKLTVTDHQAPGQVRIRTEPLEGQQKKHMGFTKVGLLSYKALSVERHSCWQFFLPEGILGILPKNEQECHFVFSTRSPEQAFPTERLQHLIDRFSLPLAHSPHQMSQSVPVHSFHRGSYRQKGSILLAGALHQIHPLAGQGMNLNLADLQVFLNCLQEGYRPTDYKAIQGQIIKKRLRKNALMTHFCELTYSLPSSLLQGACLSAFDKYDLLKYVLFEHYQQCCFTQCREKDKI